jgi:hypothetical protein
MVFAPASKIITAKRSALVGVDDEAFFGFSALYRHD